MNIAGLSIVPHNLALDTFTEFRVQKQPIQKRRKNWRVVKYTVTKPGCWIAGGIVYMHPTLFVKIKESNHAAE